MLHVGLVQRRITAAAVWLLLLTGAAYLFVFEPGRMGFFPVCPFRAVTGFNCPGCGTARGLHQLLHGNIIGAFEFNPLLLITLPLLAYFLFAYTRSAITGRAMPQFHIAPRYIWMFTVLVVAFWVFRNTTLYPFIS